jgi:hypothetical protein
LVVPFLEATVLFHGLSVVSLIEFTGVTGVVLSISTGETLRLAVLFTGLSFGKNESSTGTWSLVLVRVQDALVECTINFWTGVLVSLHTLAD